MKKVPNDIDSLIAKWFSGELTEEQNQQLENWKTDPANAAEAAKLKTIWELTSHVDLPAGESFESRWNKLEARLPSGRSAPWLSYKMAAAIAAFLIATSGVILWIRGGDVRVITQNAEVKNVLLPDGSAIT